MRKPNLVQTKGRGAMRGMRAEVRTPIKLRRMNGRPKKRGASYPARWR
jgi:hypothetical protein